MDIFWAKFFGFWSENPFFCYGTPIFVNGAFVALSVAVVLAPLGRFCHFSFPSYGRFRGGTRPTRQKVFLHPTVGTSSARTNPSVSTCGLDYISCLLIEYRKRNYPICPVPSGLSRIKDNSGPHSGTKMRQTRQNGSQRRARCSGKSL